MFDCFLTTLYNLSFTLTLPVEKWALKAFILILFICIYVFHFITRKNKYIENRRYTHIYTTHHTTSYYTIHHNHTILYITLTLTPFENDFPLSYNHVQSLNFLKDSQQRIISYLNRLALC